MDLSNFDFIGKVIPAGFKTDEKKKTKNDPSKIILSYCININAKSEKLNPENPGYNNFYTSVLNLHKFSASNISEIHCTLDTKHTVFKSGQIISDPNNPFKYYYPEALVKNFNWKACKDNLFSLIFPSTSDFKTFWEIHPQSSLKQYPSITPTNLFSTENLPHYNKQMREAWKGLLETGDSQNSMPQMKFRKVLSLIHKTGTNFKEAAEKEFHAFAGRHRATGEAVMSHHVTDTGKLLVDVVYEAYIKATTRTSTTTAAAAGDAHLEIDEIVHNFNIIASDPVLGRIFGLIRDIEVHLTPELVPVPGAPNKLNILVKTTDDNIANFLSVVQFEARQVGKNVKYSILPVEDHESFYHQSILKAAGAHLTSMDPVKTEENLSRFKEKNNKSELVDGFTRGIIYIHDKLSEIIKPVPDLTFNTDHPDQDTRFNAEFLSHGLRVAVGITKKTEKDSTTSLANARAWFSLTRRRLEMNYNGKEVLYADNAEGCIHIDSPMAYIDDDGSMKNTISPAVFEYSEGLLLLKSAFSKGMRMTANQKLEGDTYNMHDDGLRKSQARFNNVIGIYKFPFTEITQSGILKCLYTIPESYDDHKGPKLRFGDHYSFILYREYLNGWGLPLEKNDKDCQISIEEMQEEAYYPKPLHFLQLENFKPVLLFQNKKIAEDVPGQQPSSVTEKEGIHELVIRSLGANDNQNHDCKRHVLPARIALEHAFWHNLLTEPNMSPSLSYEWKRKYNCPFHTPEKYNEYINKKDSSGKSLNYHCSEGCTSFCGSTAMNAWYDDRHISPRFLTDPAVEGFKIKLFYDKDLKMDITTGKEDEVAYFDGEKGIKPVSCSLYLDESGLDITTEYHSFRNYVNVFVKKGMTVYAKLFNVLNSPKKAFYFTTKISEVEEMELYNKPRILTLVHAVREPLIVPLIKRISSLPTARKRIEHINEWINKPAYQQYFVSKNIISDRKPTGNSSSSEIGSTKVSIELEANFERLDATGKISFVMDAIPTGSLELWMRKEEYIDDPEHVAQDPSAEDYNSAINHHPEYPVWSFSQQQNKFNKELKIDFSAAILEQMKNIANVRDIEEVPDPCKSLITTLQFEFDCKSTRFEEREYFLKDISKYKGYFTDESVAIANTVNADEALEPYALPKIKDVTRSLEKDSPLRFKVMLLNNQPPMVPDIAYAITTIQEDRSYPRSTHTISEQRGNIITVYLKRGRLCSGKGERVGLIVDSVSLYNKIYRDNGYISKVGADSLSDRFYTETAYLRFGDIIIPANNEYDAGYDNELGLYHFLPKFDLDKQLWKFEVELNVMAKDGRQLHNPFINLSLVHYQPFSINYNDKDGDQSLHELRKDCRLSLPDNSAWCYLLPERKLSAYFDEPGTFKQKGTLKLTLSFDHESLHHFQYPDSNGQPAWKVKSNFVVCIEGSHNGAQWSAITSHSNRVKDDGNGLYHLVLTKEIIEKKENQLTVDLNFDRSGYRIFRVRVGELEWMDNTVLPDKEIVLEEDPLEADNMRLRYVELVYHYF